MSTEHIASESGNHPNEFEKMAYEHKLAVWRILIEKVLLGAVIALFAFMASRSLESFKSNLTEERFHLEKRLEGVQSLGTSYSRLADLAYECGVADDPVSDELLQRYTSALNEFTRESNQWNVVFDESFETCVSHHVWIHDGIATGKVEVKREHWPFMLAVFDNFNVTLRAGLDLKAAPQNKVPRFEFSRIDPSQMGTMTGHEFFTIQYKKWQAEQK